MQYLLEVNTVLVILYLAYRLLFGKDRNFPIRRVYLLGIIALSVLLPLIPDAVRATASRLSPVAIQLEGITIYANQPLASESGNSLWPGILRGVYLSVLALGMLRLVIQLGMLALALHRSDKTERNGLSIVLNPSFHASSFFHYIFMDPQSLSDPESKHILEHEKVHHLQGHSLDRLLCECFALFNWFNPVVWMYRQSLIQNLEFLADSAVIRQGTNTHLYQLSMINQHIGSASITNQFSNQLKKRIIMLNKNYKRGSSWKIAMILPMVALTVIAISCSDKEVANDELVKIDAVEDNSAIAESGLSDEVFYVVEDMPTFNGEEPTTFRKYIATNLRYPKEASANGVSGKVFIRFVVTSTGKVVVPDQELVAKMEQKPMDEVVVVTYRKLKEDDPDPDEKYIQMLKDEVIRVISESPDWEPGKQRGKKVNVMFTFPVTFALQ